MVLLVFRRVRLGRSIFVLGPVNELPTGGGDVKPPGLFFEPKTVGDLHFGSYTAILRFAAQKSRRDQD